MNGPVHAIRLRGPWTVEVVRSDVPAPVKVGETTRRPFDADWFSWLGDTFCGAVRMERPFHLPTGLESHQRISIVVRSSPFPLALELNGHRLGRFEAGQAEERYPVRSYLKRNNLLRIDAELPPPNARQVAEREDHQPQWIGAISLEIVG